MKVIVMQIVYIFKIPKRVSGNFVPNAPRSSRGNWRWRYEDIILTGCIAKMLQNKRIVDPVKLSPLLRRGTLVRQKIEE
jgi:hypothetical protein